jgi:murein DD-endopeptidase MepM/ murein hydrolase activator NlpD
MNENLSFKFCLLVLPFGLLLFTFYGCAPAPYVKAAAAVVRPSMPGVYHRVERGETLWRISKIYNVDLDELAGMNRISDATRIEVGQQIFIPNRQISQKLPVSQFSDDFIWPVKGTVISSFGQTFNHMMNKGINIKPLGASFVVAARSGRVVFYSQRFGSYGKTLIIEHGDGFSSVYARNAQVFVKPGDTVQKGLLIAKVGSAGRDRNEYLHFQIRKGHVPQNPYFYLSR